MGHSFRRALASQPKRLFKVLRLVNLTAKADEDYFGTARMKPWPYQTSRPAPLVRMAPVRVSNAFHEDGCLGVYLACPLDSLSLRCPVIADPVGIRPPDRVIAFFISSFDKQFATHLSPLIQM